MAWLWFGLAGFGLTVFGGYFGASLIDQAAVDRIFHPGIPHRGPGRWLIWALRNLLGLGLVISGVVLLVVPGPGVLAIVAGLLVSELPGRRWILRALLRMRSVREGIDHLRRRRGRDAITWPDEL